MQGAGRIHNTSILSRVGDTGGLKKSSQSYILFLLSISGHNMHFFPLNINQVISYNSLI